MFRNCEQEPTATEYFAAISAALDGTDQTRVPQLLALLAAALPAVNPKLLRGRFAATATTLLRIIAACDEASESEGILYSSCCQSITDYLF
jgi:hypothetical protein